MRWIKPLAWTIAVLALLVGAYAWAGYRLAPRLIQSKLPAAIAAATGQRLTLGAIVVRPFQLSVEATDVALAEPDGTPLLGAQRLFVDAQLASIWRRGVVLRALVLDEPAVNLVLRKDGSLNLVTAFESKQPAPPDEAAGSRLLLVSIGEIAVNRGVVDATDLRRGEPLTERLAPLNLRVQNFTTRAGSEGSFHLAARGEQGGALTLEGQLGVRPFLLEGNLRLEALAADTAWRLAGQYGRIAAPTGTIDLKTAYRIASTDAGVDVNLAALDIDARELALRAADADGAQDWIRIASFTVGGASVDVRDALVRLPDIRVQGLDVRAWREADGAINLAALLPAHAEVADEAGAPAPAAAQSAVADPAAGGASATPGADRRWRIEAPQLRVTESRVEFEDRAAPQPVRYVLAPLGIDVDGYASDAPSVDIALRSGFNESGHIGVAGTWRLDQPGGEFTVDARKLPVPFVQPYLDASTDLVLTSGNLSVDGKLDVGRDAKARTKVGFEGSVTLADFHSVDRALREDFVTVASLALTGIRYASAPASLRVRDVVARAAHFKLVIAPDQSTNIADVLSPPRLRDTSGTTAQAAAPQAAAPPAKPAARPMAVRIDTLRLAASSANFADLSIRPSFATGIEELEGTISGLSSDPAARADVQLDGKVDRYAPVQVRGQVNYLSSSTFTDLAADFHNIELPTFTPYSGKFMGYKIEKGKLDAHFHYLVENRKLDAQHKFVLDQFTLGERVDSDDAVHLPIKLAVALLKDRNGVIDIDLPVAGSLDDPSFRVAPLVWKALRNLLVKIATAPFALLGSLFGGGEEVRFVDFDYGSAVLDAAAQQQLANLGKALVERPQLKLDVPLVVDPQRDRAALVEARLDTLLGGAEVRALHATDPEAYQKAIDAAWRTQTGERQAPRPEREQGEDRTAWALRTIDATEDALRARITVTEAELAALALERADAVREALAAGSGLEPERVFVTSGAPETAGEAATPGRVRLALGVE